ncbi:MAG: multidrug transporter [Rickettsiaceae bacterium]|jgi:drug/metabolite transporter (DMT)-like permease|nr:multidrug transporter [Rickettsiaceae bacterium]
MSWIIYTIGGAAFQTFRNLEQKVLNQKLDALTVSWSRFILPFPFAIIVALNTFSFVEKSLIIYCIITAFFQVAGNIFLLQTLKSKNFSVGVAFYKTEALQAMIVGMLLFNEKVSFSDFVAIITGMSGVILMSGLIFNNGFKIFVKSMNNKSTFYGLMSGFCFSISAFNLKFASATLVNIGHSNLKAALVVLMWVILFQNILFIAAKLYGRRLKKDLKSLVSLENKYAFFKTTILSFLGSVCWFTAFGMEKVVYVKAVGQIELVIAIMVSHFILKEKIKMNEITGMILTSLGILGLVLLP